MQSYQDHIKLKLFICMILSTVLLPQDCWIGNLPEWTGLFFFHFTVNLLCFCSPGDELENMKPDVYRNISKQLRISVAMEAVVLDAFLSVATEILSLGTSQRFI